MGKPKTLSKKEKKFARRKGIAVKGSAAEASASKYSIDAVLDKATEAMEVYDYEMAQKFCQRALEMDNDNIRALEITSTLLLEAGDIESASQCLGRAITVAPSSGHAKYLSLAQLMEGKDSLELCRKGIEILEEELRKQQAENAEEAEHGESSKQQQQQRRKDLSSAYCAVAELYMTDLCDEADAGSECARCVGLAVETDTSNPESWQTKARLHLVKGDFEDARSAVRKSLELWLPRYEAAAGENGSQDDDDPVDVCPLSYACRISVAKILVELEEWDDAGRVLDSCVEEDEDAVDAWYLLGWSNKLRADLEDDDGDGYRGNARFYLRKAMEAHKKRPADDRQLVDHVAELIEELGPEDEEEDDWEDCPSSGDEGGGEMDES